MTNHPHRNRDDETTESAGEEPAAHLEAAGAIPPQGSAEVPAHTGNGLPPGLKPNTAKVAAEAVAEALGQHLPQMLFQAVAAALQQVPVTLAQQHVCATCLAQRITWENIHHADVEKAVAAAAQAAGTEPGSPQAAQLDMAVFLPPDVRAGMPDVRQAITACQGSAVCPMHIPGVQAGRSPLLIANAAMSPAMLAQFAGAR